MRFSCLQSINKTLNPLILMFQGESDAFQIKECNIQLVIYVLPHFLFIRQNGINNWSTQGQHLLLSGFVEKVERGGQDRECFLLSFQHLFSSGHGDDGSWRKHSQPDVRGTTHTHTHIHTHTHTVTHLICFINVMQCYHQYIASG